MCTLLARRMLVISSSLVHKPPLMLESQIDHNYYWRFSSSSSSRMFTLQPEAQPTVSNTGVMSLFQ